MVDEAGEVLVDDTGAEGVLGVADELVGVAEGAGGAVDVASFFSPPVAAADSPLDGGLSLSE